METATGKVGQVTAIAKRMLHRLLAIGENRLELLLVEVQEERDKLIRLILMAAALAACGLLAGFALTLAVMLFFWERSPAAALLALTAVYGVAGAFFYSRIMALRRGWQTLPGTLDQLRKDRECLDRNLP